MKVKHSLTRKIRAYRRFRQSLAVRNSLLPTLSFSRRVCSLQPPYQARPAGDRRIPSGFCDVLFPLTRMTSISFTFSGYVVIAIAAISLSDAAQEAEFHMIRDRY